MEFNCSYASAISNAWNHSTSKCLLCPNLVNVTEDHVIDRNVLLDLIHHMQLEIAELPDVCTGITFPLCLDCRSVVLSISKLNGVIERSHRRIEAKIKKIEKSVVDGELMQPQPGTSSMMFIENQRFFSLPEAVLKAYKGKLFQKREQQEVESGIHSQVYHTNDRGELNLENFGGGSTLVENEIVHLGHNPDYSMPETPLFSSTAAIQEINQSEEEENGIYTLTARKRKVTFQGVEMLLAEGTGMLKDKSYIQCSLCDFSMEKGNLRKDTSYLKLKTHILNVHRNTSGVPTKPRALGCASCNLDFSNLRELQQHKAFHPPPPPLECDICGKPMAKSCKPIHLLHHKFSHKNDDERKAAVSASEPGARKNLLANKLGWGSNVYQRKRKSNKPKRLKSLTIHAGIGREQVLPTDMRIKLENNCERVDVGEGSYVLVKQEHLEMFLH